MRGSERIRENERHMYAKSPRRAMRHLLSTNKKGSFDEIKGSFDEIEGSFGTYKPVQRRREKYFGSKNICRAVYTSQKSMHKEHVCTEKNPHADASTESHTPSSTRNRATDSERGHRPQRPVSHQSQQSHTTSATRNRVKRAHYHATVDHLDGI